MLLTDCTSIKLEKVDQAVPTATLTVDEENNNTADKLHSTIPDVSSLVQGQNLLSVSIGGCSLD